MAKADWGDAAAVASIMAAALAPAIDLANALGHSWFISACGPK
jgi:hypothetical protein